MEQILSERGGVEICLVKMLMICCLVLDLFKEFVGGILIAVLLHLGQVTLFWCHCCIHLAKTKKQKHYDTVH